MIKKHFVLLCLVSVVSAALAALPLLGSGRAGESIVFGALLAIDGQSGPVQEGVDIRDGMMLAASEINDSGGINGNRLEIIVADTKTSADRARELFFALEDHEKPLVYLSMYSSISVVLAPYADEHDVVLMGLVVTAPVFTDLNAWTYRFWPMAGIEAEPIATMVRQLGIPDMGILYVDDEYGRAVHDQVIAQTRDTGLRTRSRGFGYDVDDYKDYLSDLADLSAVYAVGFPFQTLEAIQALRGMDYGGKVFATNASTAPWNRELPAFDGVYAAAPTIYNPNFPFVRNFEPDFESSYKRKISHYAASGYDCVKLLSGLLEGSDMTRNSVRELLEKGFSYVGVLGSVDLTSGERDIQFPLYPARIAAGSVMYDWE